MCVTNEAFVTKMRLFLNIPINRLLSNEKCICSNSPQLTLRHALNCSKLVTYRSSLHGAVKNTPFKAKEKHRKYDEDIEEANAGRNTQLVFIAFPFSINGRLVFSIK
ncbi:hypothetical protein P9112_006354 [Eukaryota sp. TZLM1-RC]